VDPEPVLHAHVDIQLDALLERTDVERFDAVRVLLPVPVPRAADA
jgi:hypothetical protein